MQNRIPIIYSFSLLLFIAFSCQREENQSLTPTAVLVKTAVKIAVGTVIYENLDAIIRVTGYDAGSAVQWQKEFDYSGPSDTLAILNGFHHYSIELINKWGVADVLSEISAKELQDGRMDGPLPITYNLAGSKPAKRLSMYVTFRETDISGSKVYQPESRVLYQYAVDGRLLFIHHEIYDPATNMYTKTKTEAFTYAGTAVAKIETLLNGSLYAEYIYEYGPNKITEINHSTGIVTTQIATTDEGNVTVNYSLSNGNSLFYTFVSLEKNIVRDKTVKSDEVCNEGSYTYDKNVNPFHLLGYMDFDLQNWSASNKLSDHIDFIGCSIPTIFPLFHYYVYDPDGYPKEKITTYHSHANKNTAYHEKVSFFYE